MGELQWSGNGTIATQCSKEVEVIENHKLAQVISEGIRQHFSELFYVERDLNNALINERIKADSVVKQLRELENSHALYQRQLKSLKWYQSEDKLRAKQKDLFQQAKQVVGIENLAYHEGYYDFIGELRNEVVSKIKNDLYLRDKYPSQNTIISILLLTPDFKNKSFKELIKVINNQTN